MAPSTPTAPSPPLTIAIIGAGIASLALATALHTSHPHLDIRIFESATSYPDYGAGLAMHANALRAMDLLHPSLKKAYHSVALGLSEDEEVELATQIVIADGKGKGTTVAQLGRAKGRKVVARAPFLQAMLKLLPEGMVRFGMRVKSISEPEPSSSDSSDKISLTFADGTIFKADCVIGADGVHSIVRKHLLGPDHPAARSKNHDGWCLYPRSVPMQEAREAGMSGERLAQPHISCGGRGLCISLPMERGERMSLWFLQQDKKGEGEEENGEEREERRKGDQREKAYKEGFERERYDGYDKDVRVMAELVSQNTDTPWILQDHDPAPFYARGRVVMIGDAAHATLPFNGQGAAQALEDAAVLKVLFTHMLSLPDSNLSDLTPTFAAFDHARRARSQRVVEISRMFGRCYVLAQEGVGDDPEKIRAALGPAGAYTNNVDLGEQNREAVGRFEELRGRRGGEGDV